MIDASPPDPVSATARSYDDDAASWHAAHRGEDRSRSRRESYKRFAALLSHRGLVLDLGCGSGLDIPLLTASGLTVIGLDISRALLRLAQADVPDAAGRLLRGDARALPLAAGVVDGVWADGSLHHLPKADLADAVREVARILRPNGLFGMSVERGDFQGFVEHQEGVAGQRWYAYYEAEELRAVVEAAHLRIVDLVLGGASEHTAGFVGLLARKALL